MGHGRHWSALDPDVEGLIERALPPLLQQGRLGLTGTFVSVGHDGVARTEEVAEIVLGDGPIRLAALVTSDTTTPDDGRFFQTAYPLCWDGMPNAVRVERVVHPADDEILEARLEGVYCDDDDDVCALAFYNPYFFAHADRYQPGETYPFLLAGLAYHLAPAVANEIVVTEGDILELERERIRREDPDADASAVTSVTVSIDGMRYLFPDPACPDDVGFRTILEEVGFTEVLGMGVYRLRASFLHHARRPLALYIYASETVLGDYRPAVGDRVEGTLWLQGRLAE